MTAPGGAPLAGTAHVGQPFTLSYRENGRQATWRVEVTQVQQSGAIDAAVVAYDGNGTIEPGTSAPATPAPGMKFVIAQFQVTNEGTSANVWDAEPDTVTANAGSTAYSPSFGDGQLADAYSAYYTRNGAPSAAFNQGANPGVTSPVWGVWSVPSNVKITSLSVPDGANQNAIGGGLSPVLVVMIP